MAKKLSTEEKMAIILEGLRREKSVSKICREHGISKETWLGILHSGDRLVHKRKAWIGNKSQV